MPRRFEGLGAIALIMAYVTAFYDRYRERATEFYAYPDFFTFQGQTPCADYAMCDIWPQHKNVHVSGEPQQTAEAIADRGVTVLLVPDGPPREVEIAQAELESARRTIGRSFAYSASGSVEAPDLIIECMSPRLSEYAQAVIDSVPAGEPERDERELGLEQPASGTLRQSFRELDLDGALQRI